MAKLKLIKVTTCTNGYSLTVGNKEYFAFDEEKLMEAIFCHVGLKMDDYMNTDVAHDLMTACAAWPQQREAIEGTSKMVKQIEKLQYDNSLMNGKILQQRDLIADLRAQITRLKPARPYERKSINKSEVGLK